MKIVKAPGKYTLDDRITTIFLAGSIEMGAAENWQDTVEDALADYDVLILNPRRDDWDDTWEQSIDDPQFREQVVWELKALEDSSHIMLYLDPETKSPISMLELGLWARSGKLVVCCPEGFWRKGNIDIVCNRYGVEQYETLEDMINFIIDEVQNAR